MRHIDPQQVEDIFDAALELPADKRARFLSEKCGDAELYEEVESLLNSYQETFLEKDVSLKALELLRGCPSPGDIVGRKFKIIKLIGSGGMGDVFASEDTELGRPVAVKVLAGKFTQDTRRVKNFVNEARAASRIKHPNILTVHDFIAAEDGTSFIVTELVEGETLRRKLKSGPLDVPTALGIARQMASALEAAHKSGIIHRDVKPENVIVSDDGHVTILDFGIAKLAEREPSERELATHSLSLEDVTSGLGTVNYMSPEQVRALHDRQEVGGGSDVWSLGVCLYEMLTGAEPFKRETQADTFAAILNGESAPPGQNVPAELAAIVKNALRKKPGARYQTMREFRLALENLKLPPKPPADPDIRMDTFWTWATAPRNFISRLLTVGWLLCLIISLTLAGYFLSYKNYPPEENREVVREATEQNKEGAQRRHTPEELVRIGAARSAQVASCVFHLILLLFAFIYFYRRPGRRKFREVKHDIDKTRLKPAITSSTGYVKVSDWTKARGDAEKALRDYRKLFAWLLAAWATLYLCMLLRFYFGNNNTLTSIFTQANNINTLCIWLCFHVLNQPITTENKSRDKKGLKFADGQLRMDWLVPVVVVMLLWFGLEFGFASSFPQKADSIRQASKFISGMLGGVAMALFVGRLQSKFLKSPSALVYLLYLYTVIQAMFIFYGDDSVTGETWTAVVMQSALFLKCLLILYMFWLFQSGRLLFYLVRVRRASDQADDEWGKFREVLAR